jgi:hypothetical protein
MRGRLIFGLDFDGTYTDDKASFDAIIRILEAAGHVVVVVTNRPDTVEHWREVRRCFDRPAGEEIRALFTNGRPKRQVAREAGYEVDIWIDDNPALVDFGFAGIEMAGFQR